ncbi:aspartate:alanine exchanger family transporter [Symbiobacterium thermophilum]|uniref:Transporter n=1 Tax=Symbiobacterium thermophilum TaxID=2734 RepID=A0A953LHZ3_SYMTR|nr:aspartate:alanine exchanger family transporter [Symbiobacterium thermophilum]MBY6277793.1 transporter [Symbiobacterium thermophilum]
MLDILRDNPLLLLFIVAGIGYPLGRVRIGGIHLGVAAVLFVGLAFGALDPSLKLPEIVYQFGLALFVYCVGLSSGHGFLRSFRGKGVIYNLLTLGVILLAAALLLIPHYLLSLRPGETAGVFAGLLTSTPALAAAVEYLTRAGAAGQLSDPVVGYSIAYPASVLGVILAIYLAERCFRIDYRAEARTLKDVPGVSPEITCWTLRVCRPKAFGRTVRDLVAEHRLQVVFGRIRRGDHADVVSWETHLEEGDLVTAVGPVEELERAAQVIGCVSEVQADLDRSEVDMREVFVSNPEVAGRTLRELNLPNRFGAVVSRVWRGDLQLLPYADMPLELGDRVRVLSRRERQQEVAAYLGDSYRAISEIDIAVLGLGMALGIGLGLVPIPLPGGITVRLGLAGGPLIVALFLGARQRTGSLVWVLPYSANMVLRQMGLTIFLAAVGTRSGYEFAQMLTQPRGWAILGASAAIIVLLSWVMLYVGYRWLRIPMGLLTGMVAGMQTQSATLGFALDQAGNDLPTVGYAMVYPIAMVVKIVLAPVLLALLT